MYTILYSHVFYLFDSEHLLPLATEATEHPSQVSASYSVLTTVPRTTFCISHSATHVALIYTNDSNKQTTISLRCQEFYEGHLPRIHRLHDLLLPSKISLSLSFSPFLLASVALHHFTTQKELAAVVLVLPVCSCCFESCCMAQQQSCCKVSHWVACPNVSQGFALLKLNFECEGLKMPQANPNVP